MPYLMFFRRSAAYLALIVSSLALATQTQAQQASAGNFTLEDSTIDAGGGRSSGGDFVLTGTIGQSDARRAPATGGGFAVSGGFWASASKAAPIDVIFQDRFQENQP